MTRVSLCSSCSSWDNEHGHRNEIARKYIPNLQPFEEVYKDLHQHPELGGQESRTSQIAADHLCALGYEVHQNIGGHGVVGMLRNGTGQVVLLRADMDALPIKEETGLPYASQVVAKDAEGREVPVMHACGHDMHVTCLLAVATTMLASRDQWKGTLICLFQPDEETGHGAQAMVDGGLYDIIPKPDFILGQHVNHLRSGNVATRAGPTMSSADFLEVTLYGRGGHGSQPQTTIDPLVLAACTLVRLQTVVSRSISPRESAVVTCGYLHGGTAANIIPDEAKMRLDLRSFKPAVRETLLTSVKNIISSEAKASAVVREPLVTTMTSFPLVDNDYDVTSAVSTQFCRVFGSARAEQLDMISASEDFPNLAAPFKVPYTFWQFGGTDQKAWDDAERNGTVDQLPHNHSSKYAPVIQPTLQTGVEAFTIAALTFLV